MSLVSFDILASHYERPGTAGLGNLGRTPKVPSR